MLIFTTTDQVNFYEVGKCSAEVIPVVHKQTLCLVMPDITDWHLAIPHDNPKVVGLYTDYSWKELPGITLFKNPTKFKLCNREEK